MIDFGLPEPTVALRDRVRSFVDEQIVPYERDPRLTAHGPNDELRAEMVERARAAGLLSIQVPEEHGGLGLSHLEQMVVFEAAGWSTMGPVAMNCAAPDEANMLILGLIGNEEQNEAYLRPVVEGRQRSVFAMTEPGGAGSDPGQLQTEAVRDGDGYVVNGRKWLITGANGAKTWIVMAKLAADDRSPGGPTLFLAPGDSAGIEVERVMNTMDRNYVEGYGVVRFDNLRVPAEGLLGDEGQALRYAQMRLTPARLSHAARWLGAAVRAHSIAIEHARTRTAFGRPIGEHQGVGFMLADNEIALQQCRLAIWHAAWRLDQGTQDRHTSSMVKAYVSEELFQVADRCVQVLGGMGISDETPVAMIFRDLRAFRLYDGPTEVHKYAIARRLLRHGTGM
jgi:acyl-CoA dehydrogenase